MTAPSFRVVAPCASPDRPAPPAGALFGVTLTIVIGKDSLAVIAPTGTAVGRPTATARRLVDASVSANTRRAYAALEPISTWTL